MSRAGTTKLISDGTNRANKVQNSTLPRCHTMSVVMVAERLKAPPAFAATTMLMQPRVTKR